MIIAKFKKNFLCLISLFILMGLPSISLAEGFEKDYITQARKIIDDKDFTLTAKRAQEILLEGQEPTMEELTKLMKLAQLIKEKKEFLFTVDDGIKRNAIVSVPFVELLRNSPVYEKLKFIKGGDPNKTVYYDRFEDMELIDAFKEGVRRETLDGVKERVEKENKFSLRMGISSTVLFLGIAVLFPEMSFVVRGLISTLGLAIGHYTVKEAISKDSYIERKVRAMVFLSKVDEWHRKVLSRYVRSCEGFLLIAI